MSTNAAVKLREIVDTRIENGDADTIPVNDAITELTGTLGVEPETADNYVREHCVIDYIDGERHIITMKEGKATAESTATGNSATETSEKPKQATDAEHHEELNTVRMPVGSRTGEEFEGLPVLQDVDHPLTPDVNHNYLRREQRGNTTDIENICDFLYDPDFNLLIQGETGVGKDFALLYIAAMTNRMVRRVNFGAGTTFEDLVGLYAPKPSAEDEVVNKVRALVSQHEDLSMGQAIDLVNGANSNFDYQEGVLTETAMNGGMFIGDEINASGGEATAPLHGITESEGSRYLHLKPSSKVLTDLPVTDEEVEAAARKHGIDVDDHYSIAAHEARVEKWDDDKHYSHYIHPEFKFVGTMNPPTYAGTKPLNDAFRTRFWVMEMDYLDQKAEKQLLYSTTPLDKNDSEDRRAVEKMTKIAKNLRQSYKDMDIVTPISHREMIKVGKLSERMGPKEAMKFVLVNVAQDEDKSAIQDAIEMEKF